MARRANPALIGGFVVGAVALAVVGLVLFGGGMFFRQTKALVAYFEGSVKGVSIGAPVTFQGVKVGAVTDVKVVIDPKTMTITTPVFFEIDAARLTEASGGKFSFAADSSKTRKLLKRGLRAELELQSFVTGQVGVALAFRPDTPIRLTGLSKDYIEVPTLTSNIEKLTQTLEKLPIAEVVTSVHETIESVRTLVQSPETKATLNSLQTAVKRSEQTLAAIEHLARSVDNQVGPMATEITATARSARSTLAEAEKTIAKVGATADGTLAQMQTTLVRLEPTVEATLNDFQTLVRGLDEKVAKLSVSLDRTLSGADDVLAEGSPVRSSLVTTLDELADAA